MALEEIPMNLTAFSKASELNLTVIETISDPNNLVRNVIVDVNESTNGYLTLFILVGMSVYLFWLLADKSENGTFRYSDIRSLCIALGVSSILGIVSIMVGVMNNFKHLAVFIVLFFVMNVYILIIDKPE